MDSLKNKPAPLSGLNMTARSLVQRTIAGYHDAYSIFDFYSRGLKIQLFILLFFSIALGIMETTQIILLYPILNASFDFKGSGLEFFDPLYSFVLTYSSLPEVVTFCFLFMAFVVLTFLVTIIYNGLSLVLTRNIIVRTKRMIFSKLVSNDYRFFVDTKQGEVLFNTITSPSYIYQF